MARKEIVARIGRLAHALTAAEARKDDAASLKWSIRLADAATSVAVLIDPTIEADEPPEVDADLFLPFEDESVTYLFGGSPGNPDGVSFTYGQAKAWWAYVFAAGLNLGSVRPTLMPGSAVLAPAGMAAAKALSASAVYAPVDFNPLGLEIVP